MWGRVKGHWRKEGNMTRKEEGMVAGNMKKVVVGFFLSFLLVAVHFLGVWTKETAAAEPVKIGFHASVTRIAVEMGQAALGAQLATEEINAAGGILGRPIDLIIYDDQCTPSLAAAAAHRMLEKDKVFIATGGTCSGCAIAAGPILNDAKVPYFAAAVLSPVVSVPLKKYVFQIPFTSDAEAPVLLDFARKTYAPKTVAILQRGGAYGKSVTDAIVKYLPDYQEMKLLAVIDYPETATDFSSHLLKLKDLNPDVVFTAGTLVADGIPIFRQATGLNYKPNWVCDLGISDDHVRQEVQKAMDGIYCAWGMAGCNWDTSTNKTIVNFRKKYRDKFKPTDPMEPSQTPGWGYTAIYFIKYLIEKVGEFDRDRVVAEAEKVADWAGPKLMVPLTFSPAKHYHGNLFVKHYIPDGWEETLQRMPSGDWRVIDKAKRY
jgi:branched-chain amino acid transport system substrate-binding protein